MPLKNLKHVRKTIGILGIHKATNLHLVPERGREETGKL